MKKAVRPALKSPSTPKRKYKNLSPLSEISPLSGPAYRWSWWWRRWWGWGWRWRRPRRLWQILTMGQQEELALVAPLSRLTISTAKHLTDFCCKLLFVFFIFIIIVVLSSSRTSLNLHLARWSCQPAVLAQDLHFNDNISFRHLPIASSPMLPLLSGRSPEMVSDMGIKFLI